MWLRIKFMTNFVNDMIVIAVAITAVGVVVCLAVVIIPLTFIVGILTIVWEAIEFTVDGICWSLEKAGLIK